METPSNVQMFSDLSDLGVWHRVRILTDHDERDLISLYKSRVPKYFPFVGGSLFGKSEGEWNEYVTQSQNFFIEVMQIVGFGPTGVVVALWDDTSYSALEVPVDVVSSHLDVLLTVEDTYIIPPDASWCICYKTEGHMAFGFVPSS